MSLLFPAFAFHSGVSEGPPAPDEFQIVFRQSIENRSAFEYQFLKALDHDSELGLSLGLDLAPGCGRVDDHIDLAVVSIFIRESLLREGVGKLYFDAGFSLLDHLAITERDLGRYGADRYPAYHFAPRFGLGMSVGQTNRFDFSYNLMGQYSENDDVLYTLRIPSKVTFQDYWGIAITFSLE